MYFLLKEMSRHEQDIWKAWADVYALSKEWGIPIPNEFPDPNEWIAV